jgi:hypothetical protein
VRNTRLSQRSVLNEERVLMKQTDLPHRWKEKIEQFTDEKYGPDYKYRGSLSAYDFPNTSAVQIQFGDGSEVNFRFAFFIKATELREVAVFTEHCGYHVFEMDGIEIQQVELSQSDSEQQP